MKHGDLAHQRLKGMRTEGGLSTGGHVVVMRLLKRHVFLKRGLEPATVEAGWDEWYLRSWEATCRHVFGEVVPIMTATDRQLLMMAQALVRSIDKLDARCDWYPQGWERAADVIRNGVPLPAPPRPVAPRPEGVSRQAVLDAINYVAAELGVSETEVLAMANTNRDRLTDEGHRAILALLPGGGSEGA